MVYLNSLQNEAARNPNDFHAECILTEDQLKEFARCLLPDIIAYCESEKGKREFAEWKEKQKAEASHNTDRRHKMKNQQWGMPRC